MNRSSRSVEEVTRACYARGVPAATWLSLVQQAAQVGGKVAEDDEKAATDSLLSLLQASEPPAPILLEYLRHALKSASPTSPSLLRPGLLARQLATTSSSLSAAEAVFGLVNSALFASPKSPCYDASTSEEVAQALPTVLHHLLPLLSNQPASETARWLCRFLAKPPHRLSKKTVTSELLSDCIVSLQEATARLDDGRADLLEVKAAVEAVLGRLNPGATQRSSPPVSLDDSSRTLAYEPDAVLLASHLPSHPHLASSSLYDLLHSFLRYRLGQTAARKSTVEEALSRALADLLLPVLKAAGGLKREDKGVEGLVFTELPRLLANVVESVEASDVGDVQTVLSSALQLVRASLSQPGESDGMDLDDSTSSAVRALDEFVVALCQQSLVSSDVGASLATTVDRNELEPVELADYSSRLAGGDPDELKHVLEELILSRPAQQGIAFALRDTVSSLAATSPPDLPNLSTTCEILAENPDFLSVLFLHIEPKEVLEPVRRVLDSFDVAQDDYGDNNAVERYGALVLFLQTTVARFGLYSNLAYHLGSASSFFASWLTSTTATYPLSVMSDEERAAVSGWIAALFGEGISDDLMHATNPRTLLRVAPTILKQSLMACQAGVVDLDNLRDALSYFLQELLRFTLPGVLRWLIDEIARTTPSSARNAMLDILGVFVFSESLPPPVLELIAPSLASLVSALPTADPPASAPTGPATPQPLDRVKLRKLIAHYKPKPAAVDWPEPEGDEPQVALLASLTSLVDSSTTTAALPPPLSRRLTIALRSSPSPSAFLRNTLFPHLLSLTFMSPSTSTDPLDPYLRLSRVERAGSALLAFSPPSCHAPAIPPLLSALSTQILPTSFSSWTTRRLPSVGSDEQRKVELLADMLGGAVFLLSSEKERTRVLQGVTKEAVEAVRAAKREQAAVAAEEGDVEEGTTALSAFFARLSSWEGCVERCPGLVDLTGGA